MKVGDLVCYNAAGQRNKTLGIIIDRHCRTDNGRIRGVDVYYRIIWTKSGEYLPRTEWGNPKDKRFYRYGSENVKKQGWYLFGDWFEKIQKS